MVPQAFFQGGLQVAVVPSPHVLAAALLYHDAVLPFDKPDLRPRVETVPLPNRLGDRHLAFLCDPHCDSSSSGITFLQRNYTPLRKGCQGGGGGGRGGEWGGGGGEGGCGPRRGLGGGGWGGGGGGGSPPPPRFPAASS